MRTLRYVTADVFTSAAFTGNQLAVVFGAEGLPTETLQSITREFNYAETVFVLPPEDPAAVQRKGVLARRIATAAAALVLINVLAGLAVITFKNKKGPNVSSKEAAIREQLALSLGAAAENAMPAPTFVADEIKITAPRAQWEHIAERVLAGATAFGGSATKALPEEQMLTVVADIPSARDAEFRKVLTSAAGMTPMPAIAPGTTGGTAASDETNKRTIVQVRIAEAAP